MADEQQPAAAEDAGPQKDSRYPLTTLYCALCGLPPEYCEFNPKEEFERCKVWIGANCPEVYPDLFDVPANQAEAGGDKPEPEKEAVEVPKRKPKQKPGKKARAEEVTVSLAKKMGKKVVTVVHGLDLFDIKMDEIAKLSKKKYACGASVVKGADQREAVEIQGDRRKDIAKVIRDKYKVSKELIFIIDEKKNKVPAFSANDDDGDD